MASVQYTVGPWTLTAQTPVQVAMSAGAGAPAWFSGPINFFGRGLLVRYSETADDASIDVQGQSHYRHAVSFDDGATWPAGNTYKVPALRTSNEPLTMKAGSNVFMGTLSAPGFARGPMPLPGVVVGGQYSLAPNLPSLTACKCNYNIIQNGGLDSTTNGQIVITGLPRNIEQITGTPNYRCYWYGGIVQLSDTHWMSTIQLGYVGDGGLFTCECIESNDAGRTWAWVGTVATVAQVGGEGYSEPAMFQAPNGDLVVISRAGSFSSSRKFYRSISTDTGRTWSDPKADRTNIFAKAPFPLRLTGNGDWVCSAGGPGDTNDSGHKGHGLFFETDPRNGSWSNVWDVLVHHNAMISDPAQQFDLSGSTYSGASGYGGIVELAPNRIFLTYDYSRGAYGLSANPNRVYGVDITITR